MFRAVALLTRASVEDLIDGLRKLVPTFLTFCELVEPAFGEGVNPTPPLPRRLLSSANNQPILLHRMQHGIKRPFLKVNRFLAPTLDFLGNVIPMPLSVLENGENQRGGVC